MAKVHLIKDESIGGVEKEYEEVRREVAVGDYVWLVNAECAIKVTEHSVDVANRQILTGDTKALDPTDIVVIDGARYRIAKRNAEVGEKVLVVKAYGARGAYGDGDVFEVTEFQLAVGGGAVYVNGKFLDGSSLFLNLREYLVLNPVDSEPAEPAPDVEGILANLVTRVTSAERITGELVRAKSSVENKLGSIESQLLDAQRNIERLAQDHELVKFKVVRLVQSYESILDEVESNTKDIAFLDDRTYEKPGKPTKSAEELLRIILNLIEENGGAGA